MPEVPVPAPPIESPTPTASPEAPRTSDVSSGPDSIATRMVSGIKQKLGREVSTNQILKDISEGAGTGGRKSKEWKNVVSKKHLIHKTLKPDAQAWYRAHKDDINKTYQERVGGATNLTPKEKFKEFATVINKNREDAGVSIIGKIDATVADPEFKKALGKRIDELTAEKGRVLTVREAVREKRKLLTSTVQESRSADAATAAEAVASKATEDVAIAEKTLAETESAKGEKEAMLRDPEFQKIQLDILHRRKLDVDGITDEKLSEVTQEATDRYKAVKKEEADRIESSAKGHDSYQTEFLRLTGAGTFIEEAKSQALEFAKNKVAQEARETTALESATEATTTAEADAKTKADARDRQRIIAQPGFKEALSAEMSVLTESVKEPTPDDYRAARDRAVDAYKDQEVATRAGYEEKANGTGVYDEVFTAMIAKPGLLDSLDDAGLADLRNKAMDAAVIKVKAQEQQAAKAKQVTTAETATDAAVAAEAGEVVDQSPEDFLKGLNLPIDTEPGKGLLEVMRTDPESAKAVIIKMQEAKTNVAKLLEDAQNTGVTLDSEASLKQALGKIGSEFMEALDSDATDGRTLPQKARIRSLLKAVLVAVGAVVVGAGVAAVSGAVKISNPSK